MVIALVFSVVVVAGCGRSQPTSLTLATTTSTADTGLLDYLLPEFEKEYNVKVKPIAVGSGEALKMGERGDADVLLVHALSLIHISEPTRLGMISYAVFC